MRKLSYDEAMYLMQNVGTARDMSSAGKLVIHEQGAFVLHDERTCDDKNCSAAANIMGTYRATVSSVSNNEKRVPKGGIVEKAPFESKIDTQYEACHNVREPTAKASCTDRKDNDDEWILV
jgi:hypothetical protein